MGLSWSGGHWLVRDGRYDRSAFAHWARGRAAWRVGEASVGWYYCRCDSTVKVNVPPDSFKAARIECVWLVILKTVT